MRSSTPRRPVSALVTLSLLALLWGLLPSRPAHAQETLTLMQAIERAATGNVELRRERIAVLTTEANILAAQGLFDFRLTGDLTFQRRTTPPLTDADLQGGFQNTLISDIGLVRNLETGGSVRIGFRNATNRTNSRLACGGVVGAQTECTFYNNDLDLSFNHPILRGFGSEIVQINLRRQAVLNDQALLNRQTRASNVLRDVINTYWELAYATQDLAIRQSAVELAREQLRVTQAQIEVGRLAPIDAAAVERAIGERLQEVALSEQTVYFRSLELRRLLGLPADPGAAPFAAAEVPQASPRQVDMRAEITRALEANPQLRAVRSGMRLSDLDIQTALNTVRPRLDFLGRIGATGRKRDFSESLETTLGLDDMIWSAGLTFELPLENRTAEGQVRAARLNLQRAQLDLFDFELQLRDLVMRLATTMRTASRRIELGKATVGFAQQNLEAERARFSVGRSTNNDVLLRQQELKAEEIRYLRAQVDLLVTETSLIAATGEILERYNVVLRGM
jgi:outer membrane protein TolC